MASGRPTMANGANLGFSRSFYLSSIQDHPLYHQSPSGDDIFLLHQAKKTKPSAIHFLKSPEAMVTTRPARNLKSFINQRLRWASKTKFYTDKDTIFSALVVFFMNTSLVFTLAGAIFKPALGGIFLSVFLAKTITDSFFLRDFAHFSGQKFKLCQLLVLAFLYPFYVLGTGLASVFYRAKWKGRH
jgi:cellulose synthase/poly-beta-1,6-N-acetylglucosamine synthase-like glycosyltransferase